MYVWMGLMDLKTSKLIGIKFCSNTPRVFIYHFIFPPIKKDDLYYDIRTRYNTNLWLF